MRKLTYILFLFFPIAYGQSIYYVADDGNSGNSGTEASPWDLLTAVNNATTPGDKVWVKAGDYPVLGSEIDFDNSGTDGNEIVFEVYSSTIGDITYGQGTNYTYNTAVSNTEWAIFDGNDAQYAFQISGDYVTLRGFAVIEYDYAFRVYGDHVTLDNVLCKDGGTGAYDGYGIKNFGGDYNEFINSYVEDYSAEAINLDDGTTYSRVAYCEIRCDDDSFATDYYIITRQVTEGTVTSNNIIENNSLYRMDGVTSHLGHGLDNKGGNTNIWRNNYLYNLGVEVVFTTSFDNIIEGNVIEGESNIQFWSGAHDNIFRGNYHNPPSNNYANLIFTTKDDGAAGSPPVNTLDASTNNHIYNNVFKNSQRLFAINENQRSGASLTSVYIYNNVFDSNTASARNYLTSTVVFTNNIVSNSTGTSFINPTGTLTLTAENNNFYNNNFTTPASGDYAGTLEVDPEYLGGSGATGYAIESTSDLIDAGVTVSGRTTDFEGNNLVGTPDIGAFEYQPSSGGTPTIYLKEHKADPLAGGRGRFTTGGRGGTVIKVTSLANSGTGTLREALNASGARTVVFDVGGTIQLDNYIDIDDPNITIAGETAPGDGILIRGGEIRMSSSNIILSGVRIRHGGSVESASNKNNIYLFAQSGSFSDIYINRCSLSWPRPGSGENEGKAFGTGRSSTSYTISDITVSNCIISESALAILKYAGTYNLSFYNNLMALNSERNIRPNRPVAGVPDVEMANNIIHGFNWATNPSLGTKIDVIKNIYSESSDFSSSTDYAIKSEPADGGSYETEAGTELFIEGNEVAVTLTEVDPVFTPYLQAEPSVTSDLRDRAVDTDDLPDILPNIGANYQSRDAVDQRAVDAYVNGNGSLASSGTYPTISGGSADTDTDGDGLPNWFETEHGVSDWNAIKPIWNFDGFNVDQQTRWEDGDWATNGFTNGEMYLFTKQGIWSLMEKEGGGNIPLPAAIVVAKKKNNVHMNILIE